MKEMSMKKSAVACILAAAMALPGAVLRAQQQQAQPKALIIVVTPPDGWNGASKILAALRYAIQLKESAVEARLAFVLLRRYSAMTSEPPVSV